MATQHTHRPNFGRQVADCPRCTELVAGAEPIAWGSRPAPETPTATTTKHNHQVVFGRRIDGCPRCAELTAGAEPVRWAPSRREREQQDDALRAAAIREHFAPNGPHSTATCGPVCTFGDW
ncbi:hypothetical protein RVR_P165 (plasmid) [Actinacidiphila reveromycinica]|uniref:Uncharacterized protein n=1 Tax=Actinacidiphila reveromycinica TaxID=659352 RepID=A0A7R6QHX8_9ACTN|nr:hypothetical protein [Streptomyces sp. SN-593]BBG20685.1 hypothetical protein RVR_P165 [Streptomyces sp. SN-593]